MRRMFYAALWMFGATACAPQGGGSPQNGTPSVSETETSSPSDSPAAPEQPWRWRDQPTEEHSGWSYDPTKVETVEGEVVEVERTPTRGWRGGVHLKLKTDEGALTIKLGPAWYIQNQQPPIEEGDHVLVVGARTAESELVAATLRRGEDELILRDEAGIPAWRGWRRRR